MLTELHSRTDLTSTMADQVALQADVGNVSTNALAILGAAQPLLKALSADNINPLAVLQVQAIGNCFHSNGDWAVKLPDLLARASSVRLERFSAWIGWQRGDTASHMSHSSGGRTASLICLALGNLYEKDRCGIILHRLSESIISEDQRNASISQLSDFNTCLSDKLSCLGFGNLLASHLTRIRQCFFEAGSEIPQDLAAIPTEEIMVDFLVALQKAIQTENLVLHFYGSRGGGTFVAILMCLCPEDTRIEVEGELIYKGQRSTVIFSISKDKDTVFHIESTLHTHCEDFQQRYVLVDHSVRSAALKFKWSGWLSSCLEIALVKAGGKWHGDLPRALANLIATTAISLHGSELYSGWTSKTSGNPQLPKAGMRTLLGPEYDNRIRETLKTVLAEPSETICTDIVLPYRYLKDTVASLIPKTTCTCRSCSDMQPWDTSQHPKAKTSDGKAWRICPLAHFWATLGAIVEKGFCALLLNVKDNTAIRHAQPYPANFNSTSLAQAIVHAFQVKTHQSTGGYSPYVSVQYIHNCILSMVDPWTSRLWLAGGEDPPLICRSSGHNTVLPATLQYPRITYPWAIEYLLIDGKLHDRNNSYLAIICADTQKGAAKKLSRPRATGSLLPKNTQIKPSSVGEHNFLNLTLRPEVIERMPVLFLRSTIQFSTKICPVNFVEIHLGFMGLAPADECEHFQRSPLNVESAHRVVTTSVAAPTSRNEGTLAITLTHWNPEAQFLCCSAGIQALYQGACCLTCAVTQASEENIVLVIGGDS